MAVRNWVTSIVGQQAKRAAPRLITYPQHRATDVYEDVVVKAFFSEPVLGINGQTFTLVDSRGTQIPASVGQIGDGTWALFPDQVFLETGHTYTARLMRGICDTAHICTAEDVVWSFKVTTTHGHGIGDTSVPMGFASLVVIPPK
jgi:hypothetical protein